MFSSASRLIDRLGPPGAPAAGDRLQARFLTGAALLGLAVAFCSAVSEIARRQWPGATVIGLFGIGLGALLVGIRKGTPLPVLGRCCLALLAAFFTGVSLLTVEIEWGQLKWFTLLPVVALLLEGSPHQGGPTRRSKAMLATSTAAAVLLGLLIYLAHRQGWTAGFSDAQPAGDKDAEQLVDFVLFTISVAGLLWIQRLALRTTEQEIVMLRSMLSVCAWCKRIRDEDAGWIGMEQYMARHTSTMLTHGICPDCKHALWSGSSPP